jgi:hypothetical protein
MPPVIQADVPWAARSAGPAGMHEDDRVQPQLLLHIACQAICQIPAGLPTHYLCGAPVRLPLSAPSHLATGRMAQACARSALRSTTQAGCLRTSS